MKLQTLVLTIAVLAVLSALVFFAQRPPKPAALDPRTGQPVFDFKALEKTARIRLTDQGKTVLLAKQPDSKWAVSSYYDLPADVAKLGRLLDDLASAKIQRLVTRTPDRLARLEFKDTAIALLDPADKVVWKLTLGKDAEGGGRFVRFDDEQKGYLANLSAYLDSDSKNWADSLLLSLKADDLSGVEITFAGGDTVTATRAKKEDAWMDPKAPAGQRLKAERITSLLSSFASLRFQDTSDLTDPNAEAARKNSRTLKFTTFDHQTITVELGRKPEVKIVKPAEPAKAEGLKASASAAEAKPAGAPPATAPGAAAETKAAPAAPAGQAGRAEGRDDSRRPGFRFHHRFRPGGAGQCADEEARLPNPRLESHQPAAETRRAVRVHPAPAARRKKAGGKTGRAGTRNQASRADAGRHARRAAEALICFPPGEVRGIAPPV